MMQTDSTGTIAKKSGALVIKNKINMEYDLYRQRNFLRSQKQI